MTYMNSNDTYKVFVVERKFQTTGNKTAADCESMSYRPELGG
jgi:hypothetical protein